MGSVSGPGCGITGGCVGEGAVSVCGVKFCSVACCGVWCYHMIIVWCNTVVTPYHMMLHHMVFDCALP